MAVHGVRRLPAALQFHIGQMRELSSRPEAQAPTNVLRLLGPSVELGTSLAVGSASLLLILMLRLVLEKRILPRMFPQYKLRTRAKIAENLFYTLFYTFSTVAGFVSLHWEQLPLTFLVRNEPMMALWHNHDKSAPISFAFRMYYTAEAGFYLGFLAFLIAVDSRRSDYREYIVHHSASIVLLTLSLCLGYTRFGVYVITLHDISDIFLHGAKTVHYLGMKGYDTLFFVAFVVSFYLLRLLIFPRIIIGILFEPWAILVDQPEFNKWLMHWHIYIPIWIIFLVSLFILLLLHCYWFCLSLKIIQREIQGISLSETGDPRSDSEED